jgi:hypothetical protein
MGTKYRTRFWELVRIEDLLIEGGSKNESILKHSIQE